MLIGLPRTMHASYEPAQLGTVARIAGVYAAIGTGLGLLALRRYRNGLYILAGLACYMNFQYGPYGVAHPISFFVSIYDVTHAIGVDNFSKLPGMAKCTSNNTCTQLGQYEYHPAWAVDFYDRFVLGDAVRRGRLYVHIWLNTVALVLGLVQFRGDIRKAYPRVHRTVGWLATALCSVSVCSSMTLAVEHGTVESYGGKLAVAGWFEMAACVLVPLVIGVQKAQQRDFTAHRRWMVRWSGAMWGAFLVFRAIFLVMGPLLRWNKNASTLTAVWASAPIGMGVAEVMNGGRKQSAEKAA